MVNRQIIPLVRNLLTFATLFTVIIPTFMDLNCTHMTNPLWPPHARFHWSIQWISITLLNIIALYLLWGRHQEKGSKISVMMAGLAPLLFWGSFFPSMLMPGTSAWPDGLEPFMKVPPNVFIAAGISILCIVALTIDHRSRRC